MDAKAKSSPVYCFGVFEANPLTGELRRKGLRIKLQEQPFQLLTLLLERAGEIVSRDDVRHRLWPQNTFVDFDASLRVAVGKLREALGDTPENPRFIETVPRRGYRFLAPVQIHEAERTESEPASQPQTLALPLHAPQAQAARGTAHPTWWILSIVALVLVAAAIIGFELRRRQGAASVEVARTTAPFPYRRSVAFLGFQNLPARTEDAWMSHAFTEMLGTELGADGSLRVVSDEDVARARKDVGVTNQGSLALVTLQRLHQQAGADLVVLGSYILIPGKSGRQVRLDVRVQDTQNGELIAEDSITGSELNLFEIASRAGSDLRTRLGMQALDNASASFVHASLPANSAAVRYYAEGKAKLWNFEYRDARELLSRAIAADPDFPLAHADLSEALSDMGYRSKAAAEAKLAVALSAHLPEEEQLLITGHYQGQMNDWNAAVKNYQKLFGLRPDRLDYGLLLAKAQFLRNPGNPSEVVKTLNSLRAMPAPAGEDARIDLLEASSMAHTNLAQGVAAARRALVKGSATASNLIVARAYGILCQLGSASGTNLEESKRDCENAIHGYDAAGDKYNEARTLSDYAGMYFYLGDLEKAESMWREAGTRFRALDEHEGAAASANNLAEVLLATGRLEESRKMLTSAISDYEAIDDTDGIILATYDLGQIGFEQGDLRRAEASFRDARQLATAEHDTSALAFALFGLGHIAIERAAPDEASQLLSKAASLQNEVGEVESEAETRLLLAELTLQQGHAADAETVARKCREQFQQERQADSEVDATRVLVRALLAGNKPAQAQVELQNTASQAAKSQNLWIQEGLALARAEAERALGHFETARADLERLQEQSRRWGFHGRELEVELAIAQTLEGAGRKADAARLLEQVQAAASRTGYERIRRNAARISQSAFHP